MDFLQLAKERYSVRSFSDKPVEDEKLAKVLEAGKLAPTGKNNQPQVIYVLKTPEAVELANSMTKCVFGAPVVLVIAYDDDLDWDNPLEEGVSVGAIDAAIVATHMMLEAQDLGLGTCMVAYFSPSEVSEILGFPESFRPVLMMPLGYAADDAAPSPRHEECRDDVEMIVEL